MKYWMRRWIVIPAGAMLCSASLAQDYDFDWATITHPGNPAYEGEDPDGVVGGRGGVDYVYRISKWEVTTSQWMEYVNTFSTQSDDARNFGWPLLWGAVTDPDYNGPGRRWKLNESLPWAANVAVVGNNWYEYAQFTNWLHNGKQDTWESLETGAYDSSTWGRKDGHLTDDPTHLLGAKFWIPTLDEWLKAAYWDPDGNGEGEDRWWMYPNMTDEPVPPDETSAGQSAIELFLQFPLGMFPDTQSPWGLIDLSGGTQEWLEQIWRIDEPPSDRLLKGSHVSLPPDFELFDRIYLTTSSAPDGGGISEGVRIASIPTPSTGALMFGALVFGGSRRTRR